MTDATAGRTVLVTGGGTGIGRATAQRLAARGYRVAVSGRRRDPLDETVRLLGDGVAIAGDHANEADAQRMVDETVAAFGRLDVLVNNAAAIRRNVPLHEVTAERWDEQLTINLRGPFLVARAALRAMLDGEGDRAIVNVASTLANKAAPGVAPYSAAKAGVLALTRSIAIEYGERGIRCNAVCPDIVETPLAEVDRPNWPAMREQLPARYPLGRIGQPDDIAGTIAYLASPEAAWVSGIAVDVAGGYTAL